MKKLLNDEKKIKNLCTDPTYQVHLREGQLKRYLRQLNKSKNFLDKKTYDEIYPSGSQHARMYGIPKLHKGKEICPLPHFRPIVSSIGPYNYQLAKYLCNLLTPAISYDYCTKDSFKFAEEIQKVRHLSLFMVSFDIESLFANIALAETINLAVDAIFKSNPNLKISKKDLQTLFEFATKGTQFFFDGGLYDQIDGVAMGSPLALALVNLFMSHFETKWLQNEKASEVLHYKRYVDDIFCLFKTDIEVEKFYSFINCQHPNIKFTLEKEHNKTLPFLDILVNSNEKKIETSVYYKKIYSDLLTYYFSFTPTAYKSSYLITFVDCVLRINSSWKTFHLDLKRIKGNLQKELFSYRLDRF